MKTIFRIIWIILISQLTSCHQINDDFNKSLDESKIPIPNPEILPQIPFWNYYAKSFIYAPAFDFKKINGAIIYRYLIKILGSEKKFEFTDTEPNKSLSPVWKNIPLGIATVTVEALGKAGNVIGKAGERTFCRSAVFQGITNTAKIPYKEASYKVLNFLFHQPYIQNWKINAEPDSNYCYYGYPTTIIPSIIDGMMLFSTITTSKQDSSDAMKIAVNAATHMLRLSSTNKTGLYFLIPTYDAEFAKKIHSVQEDEKWVKKCCLDFENDIMMTMPCKAAQTLLELYKRTHDQIYFIHAKGIADIYKNTQLENGSWHLKINRKTGGPVGSNILIPVRVLNLLTILEKDFSINEYKETIEKARLWIMNNPVKTFNWEGQFEDVKPYVESYKNLSEYPACDFAMYLLGNCNHTAKDLAIAKELIRFAEDQFIFWQNPPTHPILLNQFESSQVDWVTPCVTEQYQFFVPVDASAAEMIKSYLVLYNATKEKIYLKKAITLANSITQVQKDSGEIPTLWIKNGENANVNWLNCMVFSAVELIEINKIMR